MAYSQKRIVELERRVERLARLVHRMMASSFGGVFYPLTNRDATEEQISAVYEYLDSAVTATVAGQPPTVKEFVGALRKRVPQLGDDEAAYGVIATYCYREAVYRPLYEHLKSAGLPHLDTRIERPD